MLLVPETSALSTELRGLILLVNIADLRVTHKPLRNYCVTIGEYSGHKFVAVP